MTKKTIGRLILRFIGDLPNLGEWEWDNFLEQSLDSEAEKIRSQMLDIERRFPPESGRGWCSEEGRNEMRKIAIDLIERD